MNMKLIQRERCVIEGDPTAPDSYAERLKIWQRHAGETVRLYPEPEDEPHAGYMIFFVGTKAVAFARRLAERIGAVEDFERKLTTWHEGLRKVEDFDGKLSTRLRKIDTKVPAGTSQPMIGGDRPVSNYRDSADGRAWTALQRWLRGEADDWLTQRPSAASEARAEEGACEKV